MTGTASLCSSSSTSAFPAVLFNFILDVKGKALSFSSSLMIKECQPDQKLERRIKRGHAHIWERGVAALHAVVYTLRWETPHKLLGSAFDPSARQAQVGSFLPHVVYGWTLPAATTCNSSIEWSDIRGICPARMNVEQPCHWIKISEQNQQDMW